MAVGGACSVEGCKGSRMHNSLVCYKHKGSLISEPTITIKEPKEPIWPLKPMLMITVISACIALFPTMMVNDDTTGGGAAAFLMCMTIPAGAGCFLVGIPLAIRSYYKSLEEYNKWKSEEE